MLRFAQHRSQQNPWGGKADPWGGKPKPWGGTIPPPTGPMGAPEQVPHYSLSTSTFSWAMEWFRLRWERYRSTRKYIYTNSQIILLKFVEAFGIKH